MNNRCRYLSLRLVNAFLASTIPWSFTRAVPSVLSKQAHVQNPSSVYFSPVRKSLERMCDRDGVLEFFAPKRRARRNSLQTKFLRLRHAETTKSKEAVRRQIANRVRQQIRLN
jgi:hypothetical protein